MRRGLVGFGAWLGPLVLLAVLASGCATHVPGTARVSVLGAGLTPEQQSEAQLLEAAIERLCAIWERERAGRPPCDPPRVRITNDEKGTRGSWNPNLRLITVPRGFLQERGRPALAHELWH
jgi:hypothetical protein